MNPKKRKVSIAVVFILIAVTISAIIIQQSMPVDRDYDDIVETESLKIVTNIDPITYHVSGDTISGFTYEVLNALQKYSNIPFKISVENSLTKSLEKLESGKYDLIARNIAVNSDLKDEYLFTEPIILNKFVLVQRKAEYNDSIEPIRNHLDLAKKTIYTPHNSPSIVRLKNLSHEIGDTIYIVEDDVYESEQLAFMVAAGDIDYAVCDAKTALMIGQKNLELDIKTDIGFTHLESWAVRPNSPVLLDSINSWLKQFKKTAEYRSILKKYYNAKP